MENTAIADSSSSSDEDEAFELQHSSRTKVQSSKLDHLLKAISATITSLMRLSILIRSTSPRDDYLKAASRYDMWSPLPDIGHVREKYGRARYCQPWLLERLGLSITRRRQFLKYRVEHHEKMTEVMVEDVDMLRDNPMASTKATTIAGNGQNQAAGESRQSNPTSIAPVGSVTSYEQTMYQLDGRPANLTVPAPPVEAFAGVPFSFGEPFQCPYCFTEQVVEHRGAWK